MSTLSNIISSLSSPSPIQSFSLDSRINNEEKERTPLLPIDHSIEINNFHHQHHHLHQIGESPLTFGKNTSYGLYFPHSYNSPAPVQAMLGDFQFDDEESITSSQTRQTESN